MKTTIRRALPERALTGIDQFRELVWDTFRWVVRWPVGLLIFTGLMGLLATIAILEIA